VVCPNPSILASPWAKPSSPISPSFRNASIRTLSRRLEDVSRLGCGIAAGNHFLLPSNPHRANLLSTDYHEHNRTQRATMPTKPEKKAPLRHARPKVPQVLDVGATALMLMVSVDTVYDLFASGTLPARKVGRKWITTKAAILRWIENTSADETLARAIKRGDSNVLADALNSGAVRVKPKG
jgi:excisionase family DNA binding protein